MVAWEASERLFEGRRGRRPRRHRLADLEAGLDYSTAFVVGDMLLEDWARAEGERRSVPGREWRSLVADFDAQTPLEPLGSSVRRLDLTLKQGRHRLIAHRLGKPWDLPSFSNDGSVRLARVVPRLNIPEAMHELRDASARLPFPPSHGTDQDYHRLADYLVAVAGRLDERARLHVKQAYRFAGFESQPLPRIAEDVLQLLDAYLDARGLR